MKGQSRWFVGVVVGVALLAAGFAVAGEFPGEDESGSGLSAVSIARIEVGVEARLLDAAVSEVQLDVFDLESDALVWTSGRLSGSAVVWPTDGAEGDRFRFSVKGWDRQGVLVTHQVTVKSLTPIVDITFDNIAAGTDFMPGPSEIDLDGDVIINATGTPALEIERGSTAGTTLRVDATGLGSNYDAIEIDVGTTGSASSQAIEIGRGPLFADRTAAINGDGSAWFQDESRTLPVFLPICFGYVNSTGTMGSGSGNWTVSLAGGASPYYAIDCPGEFSYTENTAVATVTDAANPYWAVVGFAGTNAAVTIFNSSGNRVQQDFYFVIYDKPVTEALPPVDGENEAK